MGAFWIFVAILTFVYIVYYAVMIGTDLLGGKDKKKSDVEVFSVGSESRDKPLDEEPVNVQDEDSISDAPPSDTTNSSADDQLYEAIKAAEEDMSEVCAEAQDEVSGDEYDNTRLAMLMGAGDETIENIQ